VIYIDKRLLEFMAVDFVMLLQYCVKLLEILILNSDI
jgi:hypothetical protein